MFELPSKSFIYTFLNCCNLKIKKFALKVERNSYKDQCLLVEHFDKFLVLQNLNMKVLALFCVILVSMLVNIEIVTDIGSVLYENILKLRLEQRPKTMKLV